MTEDDKNVLVLTKETFISNEQSMRNQHPLFCLAWDSRELNEFTRRGFLVATSSQDFRLQPIFEMAVEAWNIAHLTCEFDNLLMRSNRRRRDQIGLALCLRPVRSRTSTFVNASRRCCCICDMAQQKRTFLARSAGSPTTVTKDQS